MKWTECVNNLFCFFHLATTALACNGAPFDFFLQTAFRSFADDGGKGFVKDITDGFFPWEFHESHPEGVQFSWSDYRLKRAPFSSTGYSLTESGTTNTTAKQVTRTGQATDVTSNLEPETRPNADLNPPNSTDTANQPSRVLAKVADPMIRVLDTQTSPANFPCSPLSAVRSAVNKVQCRAILARQSLRTYILVDVIHGTDFRFLCDSTLNM